MAILRIGHRAFWSHVPIIGGLAPVKRQEDSLVMVPDLRIKVTQRPKGWFDFILGLNLLPLVVDWLKGKWQAAGDHIIVDTGKRLVTIQADKLDMANIRLGDEI
ncbi:MAG: hypothetical protein FJZ00_11175, partial [Candidatus Sericytochromatia bacterium]|nr:hypothetical protein [Candidatus Tanganyikabacteria bacterium]